MSRTMFGLGLVISLALHAYLLRIWPPGAAAVVLTRAEPRHVDIVPVPAAAAPPRVRAATPAPEPAPQPVPQPERHAPPLPEAAEPEHAPPPEPAGLKPTAAAPRAEAAHPGSFAGDREGQRRPRLRIDWGTSADAQAVLRAGRMKLVVLESAPGRAIVRAQVHQMANGYRTLPLPDEPDAGYSNRLRVLRNVPAFADVERALALRPGNDLAIAMPLTVQQMLDQAESAAPAAHGVPRDQATDFRGRFRLTRGRLRFEITHVERRAP